MSSLTPKHIELPWFTGSDKKLAFTLANVFTKEECEQLIARTEKIGYEPALVNVGGGRQKYMPDVRNNNRCIIDDPELTNFFWQRIKDHIPQEYKGHRAVGLNERLRFLKYEANQFFDAHCDGRYVRSRYDTKDPSKIGEFSAITVQIYLNSGCKGGATRFLHPREVEGGVDCNPEEGQVLVFEQDRVLHEGARLESGIKYTIRTEVMYAPKERDDERKSR
mmetsp:Transcript_28982/g.67134  ORF Transcript_28982/g.67134 Transcript_28982/m.67134 type:complete len:221 (+) Transcript_28982:52-714(+)|eukprot:CAMPEP_0114556636 /NCGR_PEP_ID=MMETSP0114-20121206/9395_1 /TAXON_ID=31324 /ORGANISM="Goniomonas sp, Strain m" /LENGTH=220 /DNA_ID=CAMNT_0001741855 /DNA_START=45 /DNA_END=707 /DNA_ORIENTATION=+